MKDSNEFIHWEKRLCYLYLPAVNMALWIFYKFSELLKSTTREHGTMSHFEFVDL